MTWYVKVDNEWKSASAAYVKEGGLWSEITSAYVKVNDVWEQFYTADSDEIVITAPTLLNSQNLETIFEDLEVGLWTADTNKRLLVSSNIGPLVVNSAFGGDLVIETTFLGQISGLGGAGGTNDTFVGAQGGHALNITAGSDIKVINNGTIRGGGGGGGRGGDGGPGSGGISGGIGGSGGYGQGRYGPAENGLAGSPGISGSGAGGTGGKGGDYGLSGFDGADGLAGSSGPGTAGFGGGSSGYSINGYNRVIYSGSGTLLGGTSNT